MNGVDAAGERISVTIERGGLSCTVIVRSGPESTLPTEADILAQLEVQHIHPSRILGGVVADLLARAAAEPGADQSEVVAQGQPAEHGRSAEFTLDPAIRAQLDAIQLRRDRLEEMPAGKLNAKTAGGQTSEQDAVDFRSQSAFVVVQKGDHIGQIVPGVEGTDGIDVRGHVIQAKKGRSMSVKLGESLRAEGSEVIAQTSGVLRYQIDRVEIDPVLEIRGDVDFETGNIDFPGCVNVSGGVKDHFVVRAGGTVTVHKLVEAAEFYTSSAVVLTQGMAGRGMGRLEIGGDLHTGYLDGVAGKVSGNLYVKREIKECRLCVERRVVCPDGTVYGGQLVSRQSVDIGVIGGPGGVETEVVVGRLAEIEPLADRISHLTHAVQVERERSEGELKALQERGKKLTSAQAERLTELQYSQVTCEDLVGRVGQAAAQLLNAAGSWTETKLIVRRAVYKGARIRLRNVVLEIRDMVQGPILLELDKAGSPHCHLRGASEPTPIGEIATIRDTGEDRDPIVRLRGISPHAA
ncbi:MAG: DUF342 domain-containing protein [Phycisphaeraceae bacterium]|nr:MAG: DUF342 domain-containing protein [Phycisphaeraceae bacterium]